MAKSAGFEFINANQVARQLSLFAGSMNKKTKEALLFAGTNALNDTKNNVPVRTGFLRASYQLNDDNLDKFEVSVETENFYAPFVEFGTSKMAAQPHLEPAIVQNRGIFETEMVKAWNNSKRSI